MKNFNFFLVLVLVISAFQGINAEDENDKDIASSLNLQSFKYEELEFTTDNYLKYLNWLFNHQAFLEKRRKRDLAFTIFKKGGLSFPSDVNIDKQSFQELEIFCGKNEIANYVASRLDRTQTEIGKASLYTLLSKPTIDIELLEQRQKLIQSFRSNLKLKEDLKKILWRLSTVENFLFSFWGNDGFLRSIERQSFFRLPFLECLDNHPIPLELKNKFDHQRRLGWISLETVGALIALIAGAKLLTNQNLSPDLEKLTEDYRVGDPLTNFIGRKSPYNVIKGGTKVIAGAIATLFLKNDFEWVYGCFLLESLLQKKLKYISQGVASLESTWVMIKESGIDTKSLIHFHELENFFTSYRQESKKLDTLLTLLKSSNFQERKIPLIYMGRVVLAYKYLHELKEYFAKALCAVGEVDMYFSLAQLMDEHEDLSGSYTFSRYAEHPTPYIKAEQFWHPFLDPNSVVTNSLLCNDVDHSRNMIVTGPNAGGKSTILKGVALGILTAQTLGIVPARSCIITPFKNIITSFDVVDDLSNGSSLFKNEVIRANHIISTISSAREKGEKCFIALDEMCRGTSPIEGAAISYSLANHIGNYDNTIALLATHYDLLTTLEQKNSSFQNYKVSVNKQADGIFQYPFRLEKGYSKQHIALDMVQAEGVQSDVINEARMLINHMQ